MNDGYITTYSGKHFNVLNPEPDDIKLEDIAHALSLICRGNGQVSQFYSVGEHCINCALEAVGRGYSRRVALACLLHDASECYLSDVPHPLKGMLPGYREIEGRLLSCIYRKFLGSDVTEEEEAEIKEIDRDLLAYDLFHLLGEGNEAELPKLACPYSYGQNEMYEVDYNYRQLFQKYFNMADEAYEAARNRKPVKLEVVKEAIEMANEAWTYYLDLETMESFFVSDPIITGEKEEYEEFMEQLDKEPERYLMLPTKYEIHAYDIMESFVYSLPDDSRQQRLADAIRGKGAFRRFKDLIYRFGIEEQWYAYEEAEQKKLAIEWCEEHDLKYI